MSSPKNTGELLGYVGGPQLHDAEIVRVEKSGEDLRVVIASENDSKFLVSFTGVQSLISNKPERMILYGMAELKGEVGHRRFVFVNWDEDDDARLEVSAAGYSMEKI
jgi:hypothetical protein